MQIRALATAALAVCVLLAAAAAAHAQGDPMAGGISPGDYLRIGAGAVTPVNAQGSLRNWGTGTMVNVAYENWNSGSGGVGNVGFGLAAAYSFLPLKQDQFAAEFHPTSGGTTTSATASRAGILEITSQLRIRAPMPVVMPSLLIGFGFINWAPAEIHYVSTTGSGNVKQSHRSGAELSIGGALDRQLWDRYAAYVEAQYVYGYTSYGSGFATPGGVCAANSGCDVLKNTTIATLRGGLRIRMGRE